MAPYIKMIIYLKFYFYFLFNSYVVQLTNFCPICEKFNWFNIYLACTCMLEIMAEPALKYFWLAVTSSKFKLMTLVTKFLHNVNSPILKGLCKFQVDIPINARPLKSLENFGTFILLQPCWWASGIGFGGTSAVLALWHNVNGTSAFFHKFSLYFGTIPIAREQFPYSGTMLWHNRSRDGFYMFVLPRFILMVSLHGSFSATASSESG